jgi:PAS domain S-box-containing protein
MRNLERQLEQKAQAILETLQDGFLALDSEFRFTYVNAAVERDFGLPREQLLGKVCWEVHPQLSETILSHYRSVMEHRKPSSFEDEFAGRIFEVHVYPSPDGGVFAWGRDITERKQLEEALRASEARFREMANVLPEHVWLARPDGELEFLNERAEAYLGFKLGEVPAEVLHSAIHPDDAAARPAAKLMAAGKPFQNEVRIRRHDGAYRWFLSRAVPIRDSKGEIVRWLGASTDIEDQKRVEQMLRARTAELEALLANAPVGFAFLDREYRYLRLNPCLAELNGIPLEATLGKTLREIVPDLAPKLEPVVDQVFASGKPVEVEITGETPKQPGAARYWMGLYYPVFDENNAVFAVGVFAIEITERKRMESELRRSNEDLERFAYAASHDLQNPLRNITIMSEMLARQLAASLTPRQNGPGEHRCGFGQCAERPQSCDPGKRRPGCSRPSPHRPGPGAAGGPDFSKSDRERHKVPASGRAAGNRGERAAGSGFLGVFRPR